MSDVIRILVDIEQGDPAAAEQLLPLVYEDLRKLAAAKMSQENPAATSPTPRRHQRPPATRSPGRKNGSTAGRR